MRDRNIARLALVPLALVAALTWSAGAPAAPAGIRGDLLASVGQAEDKLMQLADLFPEGKYGWSPDKGVRTVGEVFMHVAAVNYGIPSFMGVKPPAGFDMDAYEHSQTKKADIVKSMKDSFAHMKAALEAASDADMDKPVEMFGMKSTERGAYLILCSHAHEHLGQLIAYARSNKLVPPWTAKENEAEAAAKAKAQAAATKGKK